MNNEESIFAQALGKASAAERDAYLDRACGNDAGLRRDVEALLAAHECVAGILDVPAAEADSTQVAPSSPHQVGSMIGPYRLLEQIGGGGMGCCAWR